MPLDSTNWSRTTETETKPDLSKPSLEGLSWLLRHLPADHEWSFSDVGGPKRGGCGSFGCAYGLMRVVWGKPRNPYWELLGITVKDEEFFFLHGRYDVPDAFVTPTMVADRIDEFLRSRNSDAYLAETRK